TRRVPMAASGRSTPAGSGIIYLPLLEPDTVYLAALVLVPSRKLRTTLAELRRRYPVPQAIADPPHVTLLFLGQLPADRLCALYSALQAARAMRFQVDTAGLHVIKQGGRVTNIHVRLAPDAALLEAHGTLLDLARRFDWFAPGRYAGPAYSPHVSV